MQSKGFIKLIAVLLGLACVYQLSFTFKTRGVEKKAAAYAAQFPLDQQAEAEQHYLDSVQNLSVYNLGFRKFTYKECKEKELNLGLDLKGGMNVMLEVQVEDVIKALAGDSQNDPAFVQAIAEATRTRMTELPRLYGRTARIQADREFVLMRNRCFFVFRAAYRNTSSACRGMRLPSGSWMRSTPSLSTGTPFLRAGCQSGASPSAFSTRRRSRLSVTSSS